MDQQALVATAVGLLIIFGSLMTALLLYRRKRAEMEPESDAAREYALVHDLQSIAATAENTPRKTYPLTWDEVEPVHIEPASEDSPAVEVVEVVVEAPKAEDAWKSWASEPSIPPEQ